MLHESIQEEMLEQGQIGEQEILNRLKQRGVVDNILQQIQLDGGLDGRKPATHFVDKENAIRNIGGKKSKNLWYC